MPWMVKTATETQVQSLSHQDIAQNGSQDSLTSTLTSIADTSADLPWKLPDTGATCSILRATATGMRLVEPTDLLVGSNDIQPAPGTNTSTQACVEPASAEPTSSPDGLKRYPEAILAPKPSVRTAAANRTAKARQDPHPLSRVS